MRTRRIILAGFVAHTKVTRLPKYVMLGRLVGGAGCVGGQQKECVECFVDDRTAFGISADQWKTATQCKGD